MLFIQANFCLFTHLYFFNFTLNEIIFWNYSVLIQTAYKQFFKSSKYVSSFFSLLPCLFLPNANESAAIVYLSTIDSQFKPAMSQLYFYKSVFLVCSHLTCLQEQMSQLLDGNPFDSSKLFVEGQTQHRRKNFISTKETVHCGAYLSL